MMGWQAGKAGAGDRTWLPGGPHRVLRPALRAGLTLAAALVFLALLRARLETVDPAQVWGAFASVPAGQWGLAALATAAGFWAMGRHDAALHRHMATGLPPAAAAQAGMVAVAVSQTLGFGLVTGALARWRMLPGFGLWRATRVTLAATLSFFAGWAVVTALVTLILPAPTHAMRAPAAVALCLALGFGLVSLAAPPLCWRGRAIRWPNGFTLGRILAFTAMDTGLSAMALWLLLPPDLGLSPIDLLPAFLIALGAGLVSGVPGGVGAFEMTLLALLPGVDAAALLGAVLAWRLVAFALPSVAGALMLLAGPAGQPLRATPPGDPSRPARPAEHGLARQGQLFHLRGWLAGRTPHALIGLLAPSGPGLRADRRANLAALAAAARAEGRLPCLYKTTAPMAALARAAGWPVLAVAQEAVLDPRRFSLTTPARANLRRKLRRAEAAGLTITCTPTLPLAEMARIARDWAEAHGGERGFSMGRFCPRYVAGQRVYLAWGATGLVAFATFHTTEADWTLDLLRQGAGAPDGTMQALIAAALADAAGRGVPRLSLAAAPLARPAGAGPVAGWVHRLTLRRGAGLLQFKDSFAPTWHRRYLAAPSWPALALAGAEIARAIHAPGPLPAQRESQAQDDVEHYEFASAAVAWQR